MRAGEEGNTTKGRLDAPERMRGGNGREINTDCLLSCMETGKLPTSLSTTLFRADLAQSPIADCGVQPAYEGKELSLTPQPSIRRHGSLMESRAHMCSVEAFKFAS